MENQRSSSNLFLARRAVNDAKRINVLVDKVAINLLELQMMSVLFDIPVDAFDKIMPLVFEAKNNLLLQAKQLRAGL